MAWTPTTRLDYVRATGRYASDVTDREWTLIAPLLPGPRKRGRPRTTDLRAVLNGIFLTPIDIELNSLDATRAISEDAHSSLAVGIIHRLYGIDLALRISFSPGFKNLFDIASQKCNRLNTLPLNHYVPLIFPGRRIVD